VTSVTWLDHRNRSAHPSAVKRIAFHHAWVTFTAAMLFVLAACTAPPRAGKRCWQRKSPSSIRPIKCTDARWQPAGAASVRRIRSGRRRCDRALLPARAEGLQLRHRADVAGTADQLALINTGTWHTSQAGRHVVRARRGLSIPRTAHFSFVSYARRLWAKLWTSARTTPANVASIGLARCAAFCSSAATVLVHLLTRKRALAAREDGLFF
jgi:hypothetical protein